ncbi:MAG: MOSC domain-containing protein [Chloroflexi bacterium]|nr:MOSC domain-containing protein [Chloroflexota bacterium]
MPQLLSVNVSLPKTIDYRGEMVQTAIYKEPVTGPVMLHKLNLDGDKQADLKNHGGTYKAVYCYPHEHYAHWQQELGRTESFPYGQFGENFTLSGLLETTVHVGDIFSVGDALIQVTQPRVPCWKLENKMGVHKFQKQFAKSERVGFYVRVLQEGLVEAGQSVTLIEANPQKVSIHAINHLLHVDQSDIDVAYRALEIEALSPGWRGSMKQLIKKHESRSA